MRPADPSGASRHGLSRREFLRFGGGVIALGGIERTVPFSRSRTREGSATTDFQVIDGSAGPIDLTISERPFEVAGRMRAAMTINGTVPGPLLRFREGDNAVIRVTNSLDEDTSLHWHGIILPNGMDGVPEVNFPGIPPGETFEYRFPVDQFGTYWYHSHSGFQEQLGQFGALIVDPAGPEPEPFDREYTVLLSDWTFQDPYRIMARLKKHPEYYNDQRRTLGDFIADVRRLGFGTAAADRLEWGAMRMSPTDISDVTGEAYTYLMNGSAPEPGWSARFRAGERVRLRIINASAATYFDVRIPGLPMRVIQASGQHVQPVETDEIRVAIAETYDVIVEPRAEAAYTIFAEAIDRSGYARGTLAPRAGLTAALPPRRERPLLTMADMGMAHAAGAGGLDADAAMDHAGADPPATNGPRQREGRTPSATADHGGHPMPDADSRDPGTSPEAVPHEADGHGPGNASVPEMTTSRLHEPGIGLGEDGWRVLTYSELRALEPRTEFRGPDREIELHLTGNMERFMWSINGRKFSDAEPIDLELGERIRLTLVNDTMMNHPMHLHGMWMELENGHGNHIPRVHTVNVQPAERLSLLVTADAPGPWAFHCHVFYHMEAGMFRVFRVRDPADGEGVE